MWGIPRLVEGIDLRALLRKINDRITYYLDCEHCIGHSYLMKCESLREVAEAFQEKILPLLTEYFLGDLGRVRKVLGDPQKIEAIQFYQDVTASFVEPMEEEYVEKRIFRFNERPDFLQNAEVYRAIYERSSVL